MNNLLELYNNNNYLKLNLLGNEYNFMLKKENNHLVLKMLDLINHEMAKKLNKKFSIVHGRLENNDITFFEVDCLEQISTMGLDEVELCFRFDKFIYNMSLKLEKSKKFKSVSFSYFDIAEFSTSPYYTHDENLNTKFKSYIKKYTFA